MVKAYESEHKHTHKWSNQEVLQHFESRPVNRANICLYAVQGQTYVITHFIFMYVEYEHKCRILYTEVF
jgi:hypothetical protein